jgi:hypothetical protein
MSNNLRILKNNSSTITCVLPSEFSNTSGITLLKVRSQEFNYNTVLFQVTGSTTNNETVFYVSSYQNDQTERVYFYTITLNVNNTTYELVSGTYSIEVTSDISVNPFLSGVTSAITYNYYTKSEVDTLFADFSGGTATVTGLTWSQISDKPVLFDGAYSSLTSKPNLSQYLTGVTWANISGKPVLFDGTYASLSGKPILNIYLTGVSWSQISSKPTLFSGSYTDLTSKPNLNIYLTGLSWTNLTGKPTLFSGVYADLTSKPTLFSGVYADLTSKPTLFSGNYADLTSKPTLFDGVYSSLSGAPSLGSLSGYEIWTGSTASYSGLTKNNNTIYFLTS